MLIIPYYTPIYHIIKKGLKLFYKLLLFSDFILERDLKYILSSVLQKVIYSMMVSFDLF